MTQGERLVVRRVGHGLAGRGLQGEEIRSGLPVIEGQADVFVDGQGWQRRARGGWQIWERDGALFGAVEAQIPSGGLCGTTRRLYEELFENLQGRAVHRIWNFVPDINAVAGGLENYRSFCVGRHEAFHGVFGGRASEMMPAASAVGTTGDRLVVWFAGGDREARHFENPGQVPAYFYPTDYGPRPPSFARATMVEFRGGWQVYVSGTSSILGHETIAPGDVAAQVGVTMGNLERIVSMAEIPGLAVSDGEMVVYLRRAGDLASVKRQLAREWPGITGRATFLRADICRADLDVEIEWSCLVTSDSVPC